MGEGKENLERMKKTADPRDNPYSRPVLNRRSPEHKPTATPLNQPDALPNTSLEPHH